VWIVCGGQTGVDRAALEVALAHGIPYGGWCPRGGWAEDFSQPPGLLARYPQLRETPSRDPAQRTAWNVRDSDATLLIRLRGGAAASPGADLTEASAQELGRPIAVIRLSDEALAAACLLLAELPRDGALNVAGPRESEAPGIQARSRGLLEQVLARVRSS